METRPTKKLCIKPWLINTELWVNGANTETECHPHPTICCVTMAMMPTLAWIM